jgi:acetyl esterase/lipase
MAEVQRTEVPIPDTLRQLMAEIGPKWGTNTSGHVKMMVEAFTPVLAQAPRADAEITADIAYGPHPRQTLDVFRPRGATAAPMLMFVHGGAFTDGEKNRTTEFYSNVLHWFARQGCVGVNVEYRLAPEAKYPEVARDIAGAVAWARENATRFGADPSRIFLMGHSAGAAHAGQYAYDRRLWPAGGHGVAGLVVVSGRVRCENRPDNPNAKRVEAYFGPDTALMEDGSPVNHVHADSVPTMVAYAEFENPRLDIYCLELAWRLAEAKGRAPRVMRVMGHNHTSIVAHFNTAEDRLGREILAFMQDPAR